MASFANAAIIHRRDNDTDDTDDFNRDDVYYDDDGTYWWYSDTGVIVKWAVFTTIVVVFLVWLIGGYLHAKSRLKKGLPPLAYHRVLVSRRMRAQYDPNYIPPQPVYYGMYPPPPGNYGYPMYSMPPPPVYDPSRPPMYEPPAGGSKVDPMQDRRDEHVQYQPPPGPPPPSMSR